MYILCALSDIGHPLSTVPVPVSLSDPESNFQSMSTEREIPDTLSRGSRIKVSTRAGRGMDLMDGAMAVPVPIEPAKRSTLLDDTSPLKMLNNIKAIHVEEPHIEYLVAARAARKTEENFTMVTSPIAPMTTAMPPIPKASHAVIYVLCIMLSAVVLLCGIVICTTVRRKASKLHSFSADNRFVMSVTTEKSPQISENRYIDNWRAASTTTTFKPKGEGFLSRISSTKSRVRDRAYSTHSIGSEMSFYSHPDTVTESTPVQCKERYDYERTATNSVPSPRVEESAKFDGVYDDLYCSKDIVLSDDLYDGLVETSQSVLSVKRATSSSHEGSQLYNNVSDASPQAASDFLRNTPSPMLYVTSPDQCQWSPESSSPSDDNTQCHVVSPLPSSDTAESLTIDD